MPGSKELRLFSDCDVIQIEQEPCKKYESCESGEQGRGGWVVAIAGGGKARFLDFRSFCSTQMLAAQSSPSHHTKVPHPCPFASIGVQVKIKLKS